jgi:hypothetical protein
MGLINTLFYLEANGDFVVNKPEAKKIKEYAILFKRDKELDGSNSRLACNEMYMIYLIHDVRSAYYNLDYNTKFEKAKEDVKIHERWKPDVAWLAACEKYKEDFQLTAAGKAFITAERAYYSMTTDVAEMQEEIIEHKVLLSKVLKKVKSLGTRSDDITTVTLINESTALMREITNVQKEMYNIIKTFEQLGKTVKELATKFVEEGGNLKIPVGGGTLGNREE